MISRINRLVWSLGVTLSLGVAFVPLGCASSDYAPVLPSHRGAELPERVVEQLKDCVTQAPAPRTSADAEPAYYAIQFSVHVTEGGGVSSVEVRDSMLGGGAIEACMAGVLQGARLPVRAMATQRAPQSRAPQSRALLANPALAAPAVAPVSLAPVVLTGIGIIIVVAVVVYIATDTDDDEPDLKRCIKLAELCLEDPYHKGYRKKLYGPIKDCRGCLDECKHKGEWPFDRCPIGNP